jgi:hypothetical protein
MQQSLRKSAQHSMDQADYQRHIERLKAENAALRTQLDAANTSSIASQQEHALTLTRLTEENGHYKFLLSTIHSLIEKSLPNAEIDPEPAASTNFQFVLEHIRDLAESALPEVQAQRSRRGRSARDVLSMISIEVDGMEVPSTEAVVEDEPMWESQRELMELMAAGGTVGGNAVSTIRGSEEPAAMSVEDDEDSAKNALYRLFEEKLRQENPELEGISRNAIDYLHSFLTSVSRTLASEVSHLGADDEGDVRKIVERVLPSALAQKATQYAEHVLSNDGQT